MFPDELKTFPQWLIWRYVAKGDGTFTKVPFNANGGGPADVTDYRTWTTFDNAALAYRRLLADGIGFVLTANDPYAFIDLDNPYKDTTIEQAAIIAARHQKILGEFDSYAELSPSGKGIHIIVKGHVQEGRKRQSVEVYSSRRYMTMTGNTFIDKPIEDRSWMLHQLWTEIGGNHSSPIIVQEEEQKYDDATIYNQAKDAENGDKFNQLWVGHWLDAGYKSQSEADFALINILGFYSRNSDQIRRMFYISALGQRDKAKRKPYIDKMIQRSFDNQPVYVPLDKITTSIKEQLDANSRIKKMDDPVTNPFAGPLFESVSDTEYDWTVPAGLVGDIARFIYASAPRPVKEIALAASLGLMAGMCGRAYNVSNTGLNQYILILAGTGVGKEAAASGIDKLMRHATARVPAILDFIGPSGIASGQALIKYIQKYPCFVSIVGEFGLALQAMCAYNANSSQIMLRKMLLELYNKSGENQVLQPTIYSEMAKNTAVIQSPSFSLLGESTPESYYGSLDETMITQGLLPRFMCIEYLGNRPQLNEAHSSAEPESMLIDNICALATNCLILQNNNRVLHVRFDAEAKAYEHEFDVKTTDNINASDITIAKELWNRAHMKMLKVAALIAIGINPHDPVVTLESVKWARGLVERDINNVFTKFEAGRIGKNTSEGHQADETKLCIKQYLMQPYDEHMKKYQVDPRMHQDRVIAYSYLLRRLQQKTAFRNDRMGSTIAIKRAVDAMVADGAIMEVRQLDIKGRYDKTAKAYAVVDLSRFV